MWRLTLPLLVTMVLLTACSGGGGNGDGSNGGGGGGNDNGDGNGGDGSREPTTVVSLVNVSLEIIPFGDSFNITLHNYQSFATDDIRGINITAIAGDSKTSQFISLSNLTGNAVTFVLANLDSGQRYNFSVLVINNTDGSLRPTRIVFVEQQNAEDHAAGGIYLGPNSDGDYQADEVDEDDDNDNLLDTEEVDADNNPLVVNGIMCSLLVDCDKDGLADNHTTEQLENSDGMKCLLSLDCDGDDVTDTDEVEDRCVILADCDDDDVNDGEDNCPTDSRDWSSNSANDPDSDGCHNEDDSDDDNDNVADTDEVEDRCVILADCDDDDVNDDEDNCPTDSRDWSSNSVNDEDRDGCHNDEDIDDDGDGLIEIRMAEELNAVRFVLDGTGYKANATAASPVRTGCGDGEDISTCSGYELVTDISLTDHIANSDDPTAGWQPIAGDGNTTNDRCDGERFTAMFDGNGFEISGLTINRPDEDCIGLFGQVGAEGTIRNLGVVAKQIIGRNDVGSLVGNGGRSEINQTYAMSDEVRGGNNIGGLVGAGGSGVITSSYAMNDEVIGTSSVGGLAGDGGSAVITQSYAVSTKVEGGEDRVGGLVGAGQAARITQSHAVSREVIGGGDHVGGLVGHGLSSDIIRSYAVSNLVTGADRVGGLVGQGQDADIVQSYAMSNEIRGANGVGGLVGRGDHTEVVQSYAVIGQVTQGVIVGALYGSGENSKLFHSYAINGASQVLPTGRLIGETHGSSTQQSHGRLPRDSMDLRSTTNYEGIYSRWGDGPIEEGTTIGDVSHEGSIWCDTDLSGMIEANEKQDNNWVWDLGTSNDYPAIRCTSDSLADQRAWWDIDSVRSEPRVNQTRLDAWLDGSL